MNPFEATPRAGKSYNPHAELVTVAAILHKYPPQHNAGGEMMAHALFRDLFRRGHRVVVFIAKGWDVGFPPDLDGVEIHRYRHPGQIAQVAAEIVVTHLDMTAHATVAARHQRLPLVHLLHNDRQLIHHSVRPCDADAVVANSEWVAEAFPGWPGYMTVIHPPVDPEEYAVIGRTDDRVTLLNLMEPKGGPLFWALADLLPHRRFLGVRGAYARQVIPEEIPENVDLIDNTPRVVADVYARTKVLLMPSSYESWGRCAIEAASSGIPTICHATEGLVESLGEAGIFIPRTEPAAWALAIDRLFMDPEWYAERSAIAYARARELDPKLGDYDAWERLILDVVHGKIAPTDPSIRYRRG